MELARYPAHAMEKPTERELLVAYGKLRNIIIDNKPFFVEIPGQGITLSAIVPEKATQQQILLGWSRFRDEDGAVVWGADADARKGNYNVMYACPYDYRQQKVLVGEVRGGTEFKEDWDLLPSLLGLLDKSEKLQMKDETRRGEKTVWDDWRVEGMFREE